MISAFDTALSQYMFWYCRTAAQFSLVQSYTRHEWNTTSLFLKSCTSSILLLSYLGNEIQIEYTAASYHKKRSVTAPVSMKYEMRRFSPQCLHCCSIPLAWSLPNSCFANTNGGDWIWSLFSETIVQSGITFCREPTFHPLFIFQPKLCWWKVCFAFGECSVHKVLFQLGST